MQVKVSKGKRTITLTVAEQRTLTTAKALLGELSRVLDKEHEDHACEAMVGIDGVLVALNGRAGAIGPNDVDLTAPVGGKK